MSELTDLAKELEHYETPQWAVDAILKKEVLISPVVDPCCGTGVLAESVMNVGHCAGAYDIHDWGYSATEIVDWLLSDLSKLGMSEKDAEKGFTVFMNPPFSKAVEFVEKALELGARKVVCFQRFAWWESQERKEFWKNNPPARVYICGNRATTWLHGLEENEKGQKLHPKTGKPMSNSSTAHAWFVWEHGAPAGTLLGHIWRDEV